MTVDRDALLRSLRAAKKPLMAAVNNAARMRRPTRRVVRRVRNADGDIEEEVVEEPTDVTSEDVGVGDTVVIKPKDEIEGEIVEIVEESPADDEVIEEVEEEEAPVQNVRRRYRRVKNARVLKNADGGCDVLVPVEPERTMYRTKNVRRYRTRTVTRNAGIPVDGTYAKTISTPDAASWATVANKARKYDELVMNANIEDALKKAVQDALQSNGIANSCAKKTYNSRMRRFKNYRRVRNEDGSIAIEIDLADAEPTGVNVTTGPDAPNIEDLRVRIDPEPSDVAIDSPISDAGLDDDELLKNARRVRLANARRAALRRIRNVRQNDATVYNEGGDQEMLGLDVPSTFPVNK